jgi:hypothetical protein
MIPHQDDERIEVKATYYRHTITEALEEHTTPAATVQRWTDRLLAVWGAIWPYCDLTIDIENAVGEPDIRAIGADGPDRELAEAAAEVARELWSHWATPHVTTCLHRDHESGLCERADVLVQADRPAEPERDWRPIEGTDPKGWGELDGGGQWWGAEGVCYDLHVPIPQVVYEVREPGATAWEENLATLKAAQKSLEAARSQGLDRSEILVAVGGQRWRVRL